MDTEELRESLAVINAEMRAASDLSSHHYRLAEEAFDKVKRLKRERERLEKQLAEAEGRVKQIKAGASGLKKKSNKSGNPQPFDLTAYAKSLDPAARKAFIESLLNP